MMPPLTLKKCSSSNGAPHKFGAPLCQGAKKRGCQCRESVIGVETHNSLFPAIPHPRHGAVPISEINIDKAPTLLYDKSFGLDLLYRTTTDSN